MAKKEKTESRFESEAIKGKIDKIGKSKKSIVSVIGVAFVILIVTVLSFTQAQFSSAKIRTRQFRVNVAIMAALAIYSMIMGENMGDDVVRNNENSNFRKTLNRYNAIYKQLEGGVYFSYLADRLESYRLRKKREKEISFLKDCGIYQMEVLDLDRDELGSLEHPFKKRRTNGKETIFRSLTKDQIEAIRFVMDGEIRVSFIKDERFKTGVEYKTKDMWESAARSGRKKSLFINESRVFKMVAVCLTSCLLNSLIPPPDGSSVTVSQVMIDYSSRLGTIMMSFVSGMLVGRQAVNIDRDYLAFKVDKLTQYKSEVDSGHYRHETFEEENERLYEEYERKQQEARDSVVTPELATPLIEAPMIGGQTNGTYGRAEGEKGEGPDIPA